MVEIAFHALATVSHTDRRIFPDPGSGILAANRGALSTGFGRVLDDPDPRMTGFSELQSALTRVACEPGTSIQLVPNHVYVAVYLIEECLVVSEGRVVGNFPVERRGRNAWRLLASARKERVVQLSHDHSPRLGARHAGSGVGLVKGFSEDGHTW